MRIRIQLSYPIIFPQVRQTAQLEIEKDAILWIKSGHTSRRGRVLPKRVGLSDHTTTATWHRPAHHRRRSIQPIRRRERSHYTATARHWPPPRSPITPCERLTPWLTVARIVYSHYHKPSARVTADHNERTGSPHARTAPPGPHTRAARPAGNSGRGRRRAGPPQGGHRGRRPPPQGEEVRPRGHAAHTTAVVGHGPGWYARSSGTRTGMGGALEGDKGAQELKGEKDGTVPDSMLSSYCG